jgi:hypothetical protein
MSKEEVLKLVTDIQSEEEKLFEAISEAEEEQQELDLEVAKLELNIGDEKDVTTGKLLYTNESARKNAAKKKLSETPELVTKVNKLSKAKYDNRIQQAKVDAMKRKFSVLKRCINNGNTYE